MRVWRSATVNPSGRRSLVWDAAKALCRDSPIYISCNNCSRCRVRLAHEKSARIVHEASMYDDNCFITLTYSNDKLPVNSSLSVRDFQLFLKRLRKYSVKTRLRSFKYFMCGEYGELTNRPHYHSILFDFDFPDKKFLRRTDQGYIVCTSEILSGIWGNGLCEVGSVTPDSATYVASYTTKVIRGDRAAEHYGLRIPEYGSSSNGLGLSWLKEFHSDVYNYDRIVVKNGYTMRPSRYYDAKYELLYPEDAAVVKAKRLRWKSKRDDSFARFCAREEITLAQIAQRKGTL